MCVVNVFTQNNRNPSPKCNLARIGKKHVVRQRKKNQYFKKKHLNKFSTSTPSVITSNKTNKDIIYIRFVFIAHPPIATKNRYFD